MFHGRIKDTFTPVIEQKLATYGITMTEHITVDDGMEHVQAAIAQMRSRDVDLILCTGGMSVDPDDNTPGAIRASGAKIVTYGAPVLPGAMFLLGYYDDGMPVMGLPGCVMYAAATIFDLCCPALLPVSGWKRKILSCWVKAACVWAASPVTIRSARLGKEAQRCECSLYCPGDYRQ